METHGNVFRDREESGPVLFLPCMQAHIHTHARFPRKTGLLPSIIKNAFSVELAAYVRKI